MGVKHFYMWYSRNFRECLTSAPSKPIDVLALDLNGLFHPVAQKVFQYGNYAPQRQFLSRPQRPKSMMHLFKEICEKIEYCRAKCRPRKRLVLCVDGVAGMGKMNQQRQRRFRTAKTMEDTDQTFNPNAFTPGTKLMDHLTKYIDWYLRSMMTYHPEWKGLEVILSNEKVPGEGEHKIMQYIREYGHPSDTYCIYGMDADLIMLGMILPVNNVVIAREADEGVVQFVDVSLFKTEIMNVMRWDSGSTARPVATFHEKHALHDFILLCFLVGNDFLPTIPTMSIMEGSIDSMMKIYREMCKINGHLTRVARTKQIVLRLDVFSQFMEKMAEREKDMIETKYRSRNFFPDPLVLKNLSPSHELDFDTYRKEYYETNLPDIPVEMIVHEYLYGMHWFLKYYKNGIPDWLWYYKYLYGPFLCDFKKVLETYTIPKFEMNQPVPPFLQLMIVLPASSSSLVPDGLSCYMKNEESILSQYYPKDFHVDLAGKKRDWEGIVMLPNISITDFMECYKKNIRKVSSVFLKRNIRGKNFIYTHSSSPQTFPSFYGNIENCCVVSTPIAF